MKYIKQFLIILSITFAGEVLKSLLPIPVPASIYGMVLLFLCLKSGKLRLDDVKETGTFLIEIMPLMFIPAGVGLLTSLDALKAILLPVIIITIGTNLTVMFVTGWVSQLIIRKAGKGHE